MRQSHLFQEYCRRPEVMEELGANFALSDMEDEEAAKGNKRRR
jgi:hypothetical protein